jgi:hypothetical protein
MKRLTLLFTVLFLYGCDSNSGNDVNIPDELAIKKEIKDSVKDVSSKHAPQWIIDYTGDLNGSIQGIVLSAMSMPSFAKVTGMAMTKDMKGKAPETFMLTILTVDTPPTATMALTLADGTQCVDENASTVNVIDKESRTFKAEAAGTLLCGDKKITYTARMNKNP